MRPIHTRVIAEREARGWSARDAALAGGVSNTTWSRFEKGGPLTNDMRRAVAQAFGWPTTWPADEVPPEDISRLDRLELEVARLALLVADQTAMIAALVRSMPDVQAEPRPDDEAPPSQP